MLRQALGRRIKEIRGSKGLSQDAVAKAAGMARVSITNIEAGNQGISVESLYAISRALAIEPAHLLPSLSEFEASDVSIREAAARSSEGSEAATDWVEKVFHQRESEKDDSPSADS